MMIDGRFSLAEGESLKSYSGSLILFMLCMIKWEKTLILQAIENRMKKKKKMYDRRINGVVKK